MKAWITGAGGMLGRALAEELAGRGIACVGTDLELDIASENAVATFLDAHAITHLFNAAAYTAVDLAETAEGWSDAERVNGTGPGVLAQAAFARGVTLLHVSTDYVFAGVATSPYREDSPTAPVNAYGRSKLLGDEAIRAAAQSIATARWFDFRTSWLFGEGRSSFVTTMKKLMAEKEELRVVNDQRGRPTSAADLAKAMVDVAQLKEAPSGVYNFANAHDCTWFDFACGIREELLSLNAPVVTQRILPVASGEFPRPAPRPSYSVLDTTRIATLLGREPRSWREALHSFLAPSA